MNKDTIALFILLIVLLVLACIFIPGFYDMVMQLLACTAPGVECVKIIQ